MDCGLASRGCQFGLTSSVRMAEAQPTLAPDIQSPSTLLKDAEQGGIPVSEYRDLETLFRDGNRVKQTLLAMQRSQESIGNPAVSQAIDFFFKRLYSWSKK